MSAFTALYSLPSLGARRDSGPRFLVKTPEVGNAGAPASCSAQLNGQAEEEEAELALALALYVWTVETFRPFGSISLQRGVARSDSMCAREARKRQYVRAGSP
ncbi:hypothetical protein ISCGN_003569 [Ixodes scapularis]